MTTPTVVLQVPIAPDLGQRLEELAGERGLSATDLAAAILEDALAYSAVPAVIELGARDHEHLVGMLGDPPEPDDEALALAWRYRTHAGLGP